MDLGALKEKIKKAPVGVLLVGYLAFLGYDYYHFITDPQSSLQQKTTLFSELKKENVKLKNKVQQADEFFKTLDQKRSELRGLTQQLQEMKGTLSDQLDVPSFVKMVVTEANRVGLTVLSIKPTDTKNSEFYVEQAFELNFRGFFVQLLVFLERLSNVERIVRADNFEVKNLGSSASNYVEVGGVVQIKTYRYLGSKADEVAQKGGSR